MAGIVTPLWNGQLVETANFTITAGEEITLLSSAVIDNSVGTAWNSMKMTLEYKNVIPANVLGSFFLGCVVEFEDANGLWTSTPMYQFNPIRKSTQAAKRIVIMQPNIDTFNLGTDDSVFPMDREVARISRAQGVLPEAKIRVCINLVENDPGGVNALDRFSVTGEVERYDV